MELCMLFILLYLGEKVRCFNFDTDYPIVFKQPQPVKKGSYFGYALAMYQGNSLGAHPWIRIGAPKADDILYPKTVQSGTIYNCQMMQGCESMRIPRTPPENSNLRDIWDYGWIGASMDVSYAYDRYTVCGYRHYFRHQYYRYYDYETLGTCFWSPLNSSDLHTITPLLDSGRSVDNYNKATVYFNGQGEAGFSMHFPEDQKELILGAPGIFNWAGTPFKVTDFVLPDSNRRRRRRELIDPFKVIEVPDPIKNGAYSLFGYSVTSGYYYGPRILFYASGSPKGDDYKGKVTIFTFTNPDAPIREKEKKVGEKFGEYFGSSLTSGKINDDIYDDLVVGAPFHVSQHFNEGRVYVFLGGRGSLQKPVILDGNSIGGQFGAAVMYLSDINNDGFGDVAISAPYENENSGSVYIYKGTTDGLELKPAQKLIGKDIVPNILGFGISISKAVDMDDNGFKDISIGAHLSDSAVLFRSKPLVTIQYLYRSIPSILTQDTRDFIMEFCFTYKMFRENSVHLTYNVTVDKLLGRATIGTNTSISQNITIFRTQLPLCKYINVTIKDSPGLDIEVPIKVSFFYGLNYPVSEKSITIVSDEVEGNDTLCIRCPVLDEYKSNQTFFETDVPFTLGCGPDNECHSNLDIDINFPELSGNTFVLGSSNYVKLEATVENSGENAYGTKFYIVLPDSVYFRQTPSKCKSENASAILCDIANPLKMNEKKQLELELELKKINKENDHLDIYSKIITTSNNTNYDSQMATLRLIREADITIYGKSEQETNYFGNSSVSYSRFTHTYKIEKFGVSPLDKLIVKIQVPINYTNLEKTYTFLDISGADTFFGVQPFACDFIGVSLKTEEQKIDIEQTASRRRRDVEVFGTISNKRDKEEIKINDEEVSIVANKTLFLNCTADGVTCFDVICNFGPYDREKVPASIRLNMMLNVSTLAEMAKHMDMALISTNGEVIIDRPRNFIQNGDRIDSTTISSPFINDITEVKVALWIIIVAVIIGLILLLLLILLLIRMGFFKRTKKEELQNLKAAAEQEDKIMEIIEHSRDSTVETEEIKPPLGEEEKEINPPFPEKIDLSSKEDLCEK